VKALPVEDFCRMLGGRYLGSSEHQPLGEERTMLDKMKAEIERLQGVMLQHEKAMQQHAEGMQQCKGSIFTLQAMIADEELEPEGENEDDPH